MPFLLDTNIISEVRKGSVHCHRNVWRWYDATPIEDLFLSVLVLGEMRKGVEAKRRRDPASARTFERRLREVELEFADRILSVTAEVCDYWGRLNAKVQVPAVDGLLAATAGHHGLTVATRNTVDFQRCRVDFVNPFEA